MTGTERSINTLAALGLVLGGALGMAGTDVEEVAYAWRDLDAPLIRRKLAPEQEG